MLDVGKLKQEAKSNSSGGEVERTRAELRREREKSAAALKSAGRSCREHWGFS